MPTPQSAPRSAVKNGDSTNQAASTRYRNKDRIVEPHDYGEHNGVIKLQTYQVAGSSSGRFPTGAGWKRT
jgi:hypothetical protein